MKKFLVTFLIFVYIFGFTGFSVEAAIQKSDSLITKIENDIYGFDYSNDTAQNRISRVEKTAYGKSSSGDINKRIKIKYKKNKIIFFYFFSYIKNSFQNKII